MEGSPGDQGAFRYCTCPRGLWNIVRERHVAMDEDDLVALCSKLKQFFPSKILRKWVQGLVNEQRAASFMKNDSAAKQHSTSPPSEDGGDEDEDEQENGNEDEHADADEDSDEEDKEVHGGAAGEQGAGDGKSDEDVRIICQQNAQYHKEDGKQAKECVCENDAAAAKKAKTSTLSTEQHSFVSKFNPAPAKIDKERKISCSRSTTNAISELLLLCVCVCDEIYIYMYPLLPRRARCVCVLWI